MKVQVHARVHERHPEISDEDVRHAYSNVYAMRMRDYNLPCHFVLAGIDVKGRMLELVGVELSDDSVLIYHAMKLTTKVAKELEMR